MRRVLRIAGLSLASLAGLVIVLLVLALGALQVSPLRDGLLRWAVGLVSDDGMRITLGPTGGDWPFAPQISRVELADAQGPWLTVAGADVSIDPWALLRGRIRIEHVLADRVALDRLPPAAPAPEPKPPQKLSIPRLPRGLTVERLEIAQVDLAAAVAGTPARLAVDGKVGVGEADDTITTRLNVREEAEQGLVLSLDGHVAPELNRLGLTLALDDPAHGLVTRLAGLDSDQPTRVRLRADGPIDDFKATLDAAFAGASLKGEAAIRGATQKSGGATLHYVVDPGPFLPEAYAGLTGRRITLDLDGALDGGRADIKSLRVLAGAVDARLTGFFVEGEGGEFDLETRVTDAGALHGLPPLAAVPVALLPGKLALSGRFDDDLSMLDLQKIAVTAPGAAVMGSARLDAGLTRIDGHVNADLADLSALPQAGLSGRGTLNLVLQGALEPLDLGVEATVAGAGISGAAPAGPLLGPSPQVSFAGRVGAARIEIDRLDATVAAGVASAKGTVDQDAGTADLQLDVQVPDLGRLDIAGWTGAAKLGGTVKGAFTAPDVDLHLDGHDLAVAGRRFGDAQAALTGRPDLDGVSTGRLAVRTQGDYAARLDTDWRYDGKAAAVSNLDFDGLGLTAKGDLAYDLPTGIATGKLSLASADLRRLDSLVKAGLAGRLTADVALDGRGGAQGIAATISGSGIAAAGVRIGQANVKADLGGLPARPAGTATIVASNIAAPGAGIDRATLGLKAGGDDSVAFTLQSQGSTPYAFTLDASGRVDKLQQPVVTVQSLRGEAAGKAVALARPLTVKLSPRIEMPDIGLNLAGASLTGNLVYDQAVSGTLDLSRLDPAQLSPFAGTELPHADAAAHLSLNGAKGGTADITVARLQAQGLAPSLKSMPPLDIDLKARWDARTADLDLGVKGLPGSTLVLTGRAPIQLSSGIPMPDSGRDLDLALKVAADLGALSAVLPLGENRLSGKALVDTHVGGRMTAPAITGRAGIEKGDVTVFASGTELRDLAASIVFDGDSARIERFAANDGGKGTIELGGRVDHFAAPQFDLGLKARDFGFAKTDLAQARGDADLTVKGTAAAPQVAGKVTITKGAVNIAARFPVSIPHVEVRNARVLGTPPQPAPPPPAEPAQDLSKLDLALAVPNNFRVYGRGLDSEWKGAVTVTGSLSQPVVLGGFDVVRGGFSLGSRTLKLSKGTVTFPSGLAAGPELSIIASSQTSAGTSMIKIEGPASAIRIGLDSDPKMPNDEILSNLLFGQSVASLTPAQAISLGQAALELSGQGGGGLLGDIGSLGLSALGAGTGGGLSSGRYISDTIYVGVGQDLKTNSPNANIQIEVTPRIQLQGTVGTDSGESIGLNYKFDY